MPAVRSLLFAIVVLLLAAPGFAQEDPLFPELTNYCDHAVACDESGATTAELCLKQREPLEVVAGVDSDLCRTLLQSVLARYACQATTECALLADAAICPAEANAVADATLAGAHVCLSGRVPIDVPDTWTCSSFYYSGGDADGCDCGCGAIDLDCNVGGCAESGCREASCEYCYTDGTDLGCDDDVVELPRLPPPVKPASSCASLPLGPACTAWLLLLVRRRGRRTFCI